jgi:hypothetical protein
MFYFLGYARKRTNFGYEDIHVFFEAVQNSNSVTPSYQVGSKGDDQFSALVKKSQH